MTMPMSWTLSLPGKFSFSAIQVDRRAQAQIAVVTIHSLEGSTIESLCHAPFPAMGYRAQVQRSRRADSARGARPQVSDRSWNRIGIDSHGPQSGRLWAGSCSLPQAGPVWPRDPDHHPARGRRDRRRRPDHHWRCASVQRLFPLRLTAILPATQALVGLGLFVGFLIIAIIVCCRASSWMIQGARTRYSGSYSYGYGYGRPVYNNVGGYYNNSNTYFINGFGGSSSRSSSSSSSSWGGGGGFGGGGDSSSFGGGTSNGGGASGDWSSSRKHPVAAIRAAVIPVAAVIPAAAIPAAAIPVAAVQTAVAPVAVIRDQVRDNMIKEKQQLGKNIWASSWRN